VKLVLDNDKKVRESANNCFVALGTSPIKKLLAPHLKSVFGSWIFCMFDPVPEVSISAKNSLVVYFYLLILFSRIFI
jgi:hypothetical protein